MKRGEVWFADLGPPRGAEQAGQRPVLVLQHDRFTPSLKTVVVVPFTGNLRRARHPTCVLVRRGQGGLASDSVALCHHIQVTDNKNLLNRLGVVSAQVLADVEACVALTLGM